jgi:hypothetical protein
MMKRRDFMAGILLLPFATVGTDQYGGIREYHCDYGESAFGTWHMSFPGTLMIDWHTVSADGKWDVIRHHYWSPGNEDKTGFYINFTGFRLERLVWIMHQPGWWVTGSCLI